MTNAIINAGRINWNVKDAKEFRATMGFYHVFKFELADLRRKKANEVKNAKGIIATNRELIDKKSFGQHDKAYYEAQIAQMNQNIADSEKRLSDWQSAQDANVKKAESIFTRELYKTYVASMDDDVNAWRVSAYTQALENVLQAQGLTPAWDTLNTLYHVERERVGTGNTFAETGRHMTAQTEKKWRDALMGKICDLILDADANLLPTYKFLHILTKDQKKELKKAQNKK